MKQRLASGLFGRGATIRRKLTLVILSTCVISVLIAGIALFAFTIQQERRIFSADIQAIGEIVSANLSGPVAFNDRKSAAEVLGSLRAKPQIENALVRLPDGSVFVVLNGAGPAPVSPIRQGVEFHGSLLHVIQPIKMGPDALGTLELRADFWSVFISSLGTFLGALLGVGIAAIVVALSVGSALQGIVLRPVQRLAETAKQVGEQHNYSVRAIKLGDDELGVLTDAFNHMLSRIEEDDTRMRITNGKLAAEMKERARLTGELVGISRRAGMAEVATGVLHNVGNVLNSVNVSATLIQSQLGRSRAQDLQRAIELVKREGDRLADFITHDERGRHLPKFLIEVSEAIAAEQKCWRGELDALAKNIEHIKGIVAMQQSYARSAGVLEKLLPGELMDEAIRITGIGLERHGIEVIRDFQSAPPMEVDRHKVLQILINLVTNAKHAVNEAQAKTKTIVLSVKMAGPQVEFVVKDTGVGIAAENLAKIFGHGFTTRADGHGFGLHMGALSARELGGTLKVASEGLGQGASFTLQLPLPPAQALAA